MSKAMLFSKSLRINAKKVHKLVFSHTKLQVIYSVELYSSSYKEHWNDFINTARNATFLFHRDFIEYHQDRFSDFSLLVFKEKDLVAVVPANREGDSIISHRGLTYGGIVFGIHQSFDNAFAIFQAIKDYLKTLNIKNFVIKDLLKFYHNKPFPEQEFMVPNDMVQLEGKNMVLAIDYAQPSTLHKSKIKHFKKANRLQLQVEESNRFSEFWDEVLIPRLQEKHNAKPVHSLEEITLLKNRFPNNITQFNVYKDETILAGITIFDTGNVVKSQYGIATKKGEEVNALDFLFVYLIQKYKNEGRQFFSMGTVNSDDEGGFSKGLLRQKEEFGCALFLQDIYNILLDD